MRHYTTEYNKKMLSTNRAWGKKEKKEKEKKKIIGLHVWKTYPYTI